MKIKSVNKKALIVGWLICGLGAFFYCYEFLLRIEPSVMLPELMRDYHIKAGMLGFIVAIYYYVYSPMQIVVGVLTDRYGPRKMLTFAMAICALGSFLFGLHGLGYLAAGRFLIGLGSAFAFVTMLKLAAIWLPRQHFSLFVGLATSLGMVGAMFGDIELTRLSVHLGYQATIMIGTVIGLVLIPIVWLFVRDQHAEYKIGQEHDLASFPETLRGIWQMLCSKQMWLLGIVACFLYTALSVFGELWGIPFLRHGYGYNPHLAAYASSMVFFGWLVGAPLNGCLANLLRSRKLPIIVGCFCAAGLFVVELYVRLPLMWNYLVLFLFGVFTSTEIVCFTMSRESNHLNVTGIAVAFTNAIVTTGGILFQPLAGWLLDFSGGVTEVAEDVVYSISDYRLALLIIPVGLVIAGLLGTRLQETYRN